MKLFTFLFGFDAPVNRKHYLLTGLALMPLKYAGDALILYCITGGHYAILEFLNPVALRSNLIAGESSRYLFLFLWCTWSLPFIWCGLSMSIRRSVNAGWSPWLGTLFFVPAANYVLMAVLCLAPENQKRGTQLPAGMPLLSGPFWALVCVLAIAFLSLLFGVNMIASYGTGLFVGTPFVAGIIGGYLVNRRTLLSGALTMLYATAAILLTFGIFLLTAREGLVCLSMAAPFAILIAVPSALLGRCLAQHYASQRLHSILPLLFVIPAFAAYDHASPDRPVFEVLSSVEIAASPDVVWKNVVTFPELPPPTELLFRAGIAYPIRARIEGSGIGAIRYCEFSTGPFVEPITAWKPGEHLAFSVTSNPEPMREFNPFGKVNAPHLHGYLESQRGEFRLKALPSGRTLLEGRTWYRQGLYPQAYWRLFSDQIIHKIHERVLVHIKAISERE